jgi:hypothetical protein
MVKIIKTDGTIIRNVKPENGVSFSLEEMYKYIGCEMIEPIYLDGDCVMVCDEEGWLKENRQLNVVASAYLVLKTKDYREKHNIGVPGPLVGNVLVCTTKEFQGEEEN